MTEIGIRPSELHLHMSEDPSETEHSDYDVDFALRQMGADAMKILDSITDEVAEIERSASKRLSPRSVTPSLSREGSYRDVTDISESDDIVGEMQQSTPPPAEPKYAHIDDLDIDDEDDDDDGSLGSIERELGDLRRVSMQIELELNSQTDHTMQEELSRMQNSPGPVTKRALGADDKEIIKRILDDEMQKWEPKNGVERFIKKYTVDGVSRDEATYALAGFTGVVWTVVFLLVSKVMHSEL